MIKFVHTVVFTFIYTVMQYMIIMHVHCFFTIIWTLRRALIVILYMEYDCNKSRIREDRMCERGELWT